MALHTHTHSKGKIRGQRTHRKVFGRSSFLRYASSPSLPQAQHGAGFVQLAVVSPVRPLHLDVSAA